MIYSHFFNALSNFIFFVGGTFLYFYTSVKYHLLFTKTFFISIIPFTILLVILMMRIGWPVANFLYLLIVRNTFVNFSEATELIYILCPVGKNLQWYPLKELNKIPKEEKMNYIYNFIKEQIELGEIILPKNKIRCWILGVNKLKKKLNIENI